MYSTSTASSKLSETLKLEDIETALSGLRGTPPSEWLLVSPDGKIFKGTDPLVLAAKATCHFNATVNVGNT